MKKNKKILESLFEIIVDSFEIVVDVFIDVLFEIWSDN